MIKDYPNPFEPMTPALAWVLGLWFADGNIYHGHAQYKASLVQRDRELLEYVKALIAPLDDPNRVKLRVQRGDVSKGAFGANPIHSLWIYSKQFYGYLRDLGLTPRKSLTMEWPSWVTNELLPHFVRGLWDGDGSIGAYTSDFGRIGSYLQASYACGSLRFIEALRDAIAPVVEKSLSVYESRTCYRLQITGVGARVLCTWMYENSIEKTRLRRKYKVYVRQLARWEALWRYLGSLPSI